MLYLHIIPRSAQGALIIRGSGGVFYFEEPLEPPDLEDAFADDDAHLEDRPPFDARVGRFRRVAVRALADHDVALFVLDLGEEVGELFHCSEPACQQSTIAISMHQFPG